LSYLYYFEPLLTLNLYHDMDKENQLTTESEKRLHTTITLTQRAVKIGISALNKFPTAEYEMLVFTFINYLERFTYSLESIEILLANFKRKPNVETAIGLIIRASLLDFITITYLSSYNGDIKPGNTKAQQEFDKEFDSLVSDQIHNTIKYLELMKKQKQVSKEDFELTIQNLYHTYNFLFNGLDLSNPSSTLKTESFKSTKKMFIRINNHPLTKKMSMVYDLYIYYSKYEHFGIMTHFMQRENINQDLDRIVWSVRYIVRGMGATLAYLNYPVDKLKIEKDELAKLQVEFDIL
jgi:hypothetical protein